MKELFKSTVVRIVALVLVVFFAVIFVSLRLKNNELKTEADSLKAQVAGVEADINELKSYLDRPFDDEYVAEIASRELGLRDPREIVFYSGEGN